MFILIASEKSKNSIVHFFSISQNEDCDVETNRRKTEIVLTSSSSSEDEDDIESIASSESSGENNSSGEENELTGKFKNIFGTL
jgi:hypothetical protein